MMILVADQSEYYKTFEILIHLFRIQKLLFNEILIHSQEFPRLL